MPGGAGGEKKKEDRRGMIVLMERYKSHVRRRGWGITVDQGSPHQGTVLEGLGATAFPRICLACLPLPDLEFRYFSLYTRQRNLQGFVSSFLKLSKTFHPQTKFDWPDKIEGDSKHNFLCLKRKPWLMEQN